MHDNKTRGDLAVETGFLSSAVSVSGDSGDNLRFSEFTRLLPQAVFETDNNGNIVFVNDIGFAMFGYSAEHVGKISIFDMIVKEDCPRALKNVEQIKCGNIRPNEYTARRSDGETFPVIIYSSAILKESVFKGMRGIVVDISERKKMEDELRESEELFRMLLLSSSSIIIMFQDDKNVFVNPTASVVSGYSEEELKSMHFWDIVHPDHSDIVRQKGMKRLRGEKVEPRYEIKIVTKKGDIRWLDTTATFVKYKGVNSVMVSAFDITERKKNAELLKKEVYFNQKIFDTAHAIILLLDFDGNIIRFNSYLEELTGFSLAETEGKNWYDFFVPEREKAIVRKVLDLTMTSLSMSSHVNPVLLKSGEEKDVEWYNTAIKGEDEKLIGVLSIGLDISEKIKMARELQKKKNLESIAILAGGLAHDFNNIMTAIIGNLSILKMNIVNEQENMEIISDAESAALRAASLTKQLLSFSKGESLYKQDTDLNEIIPGLVKFLLSGTKISYSFDSGEVVNSVNIDRTQFNQVVQNLVINSVQAISGSGKISIKVRNQFIDEKDSLFLNLPCGEFVRITFSDNGPGIGRENIDKIFDPYFTTKAEGSGLGLAIAYNVIKKHGGLLCVDHSTTTGASFDIYLPLLKTIKKN